MFRVVNDYQTGSAKRHDSSSVHTLIYDSFAEQLWDLWDLGC